MARMRIMRLSSINLQRSVTLNKGTKIKKSGKNFIFQVYKDIIDFEAVPNVVSSKPIRLALSGCR